jgi:hypothetical protein
MARLVLLLTAAAGCNSVLGNDRAIARDARYFDAPFDAPFACRPAGQAPPEFDRGLHEVFVQDCIDYSFQGDRATAWCSVGQMVREIFEGPSEGPLTLVGPTVDAVPTLRDQPRLSSDGTKLYYRWSDFTGTQETRIATRQPDNSWKITGTAAFGANLNDSLSTIARGPDGDHVIVRAFDGTLHEWAEHGGTWAEGLVHDQVGIAFAQVKLSPDGLHLVGWKAHEAIYYTDRASTDAPFGPAVTFPSMPLDLAAPLMTADCARVYVAGVGGVFYAQQR